MTAQIHRIRAGAPAHVDTRQQCRLSSEVIGELIQAGTHRRNALAANHTRTPQEREYEATAGEDALICGAAFLICAAAVVGAWLATH